MSDDKELHDHIRRTLIPDMRDSKVVLMIAPPSDAEFDVNFALQIGASVLLEKPLLVLVPRGRKPPPKLERIADRIIEVDFDESDGPRIKAEVYRFLRDFGKQ